ncbi:MAG: hypothetical protein JNG84_02795 [Archangium sp.]|nr:hypothetical protein [Archangium sp.]
MMFALVVLVLALDGGRPPSPPAEDVEVIENLDLLENLEPSRDLELLLELAKKQ